MNQMPTEFDTEELRNISKLLAELDWRRMNDSLSAMEISKYENIASKFMDERKGWMQKETAYKNLVEEVRPAWYDRFYVGAVCSTVFVTIMIFLLHK